MRLLMTASLLCLLTLCPTFAAAEPPSDASLHALLDAMQARKIVDSVLARSDDFMRQSVHNALNGQTLDGEQQQILDRQREKMHDLIMREMSWDKMEPTYMDIYRKTFSQQDVDSMIAFYKSPAGRDVIQKMPTAMQESMQQMQMMFKEILPQMQQINQETAAELKAYKDSKQSGGDKQATSGNP